MMNMTILRKIELSKRYGKAIYAISAAMTLAIASLVFFSPYAIPMCVLLKLFSVPVILYLYTTFTKKQYTIGLLSARVSRPSF